MTVQSTRAALQESRIFDRPASWRQSFGKSRQRLVSRQAIGLRFPRSRRPRQQRPRDAARQNAQQKQPTAGTLRRRSVVRISLSCGVRHRTDSRARRALSTERGKKPIRAAGACAMPCNRHGGLYGFPRGLRRPTEKHHGFSGRTERNASKAHRRGPFKPSENPAGECRR